MATEEGDAAAPAEPAKPPSDEPQSNGLSCIWRADSSMARAWVAAERAAGSLVYSHSADGKGHRELPQCGPPVPRTPAWTGRGGIHRDLPGRHPLPRRPGPCGGHHGLPGLRSDKKQESQEVSRLAVWNNSYQGQLAEQAKREYASGSIAGSRVNGVSLLSDRAVNVSGGGRRTEKHRRANM